MSASAYGPESYEVPSFGPPGYGSSPWGGPKLGAYGPIIARAYGPGAGLGSFGPPAPQSAPRSLGLRVDDRTAVMFVGIAVTGLIEAVALSRTSPPCKAAIMRAAVTVSSQDMFDWLVHQHLISPEQAKAIVDRHLLSTNPVIPASLLHKAATGAIPTYGFGPLNYGPPGYGYGPGPHGFGFGHWGGYATGPYGHGDDQNAPFYGPHGLGWLVPPSEASTGCLCASCQLARTATGQADGGMGDDAAEILFASAIMGLVLAVALNRVPAYCGSEVLQQMRTVSSQDIFDMLVTDHLISPPTAKAILDRHILSRQPLVPLLPAGGHPSAATGQGGMGTSCCDMRTHFTWPLPHPLPLGGYCKDPIHGSGSVC